MRTKKEHKIWETSQNVQLTISLGSLDFLKQGLEPTKRRCISTNPEEFNPTQGTKFALLLPIPNMLKDGGKGGDTFIGVNQNPVYSLQTLTDTGTN